MDRQLCRALLLQSPDRREEEPEAGQDLANGGDDERCLQANALTKYASKQPAESGQTVHDERDARVNPAQQILGRDGLTQADLVDTPDWPRQPEDELRQAHQRKSQERHQPDQGNE